MSDERSTTEISQIRPGERINIQGWGYKVISRNERVDYPGHILTGFHLMPKAQNDSLTDGTVARLSVEDEPYELDVCNGPVMEIDPEEVERYV